MNFDYLPKDIKKILDKNIIEQNDAKKVLATAICDHYNYIKFKQQKLTDAEHDYVKQNIIITGPTGVGKTYLIKQLAKLIGVPFVKADATRFSETGYMGANVDDLVRDLVQQADGDIEKAQHGIIYIDEADKLAAPASYSGRDVSGRGVQLGLLKLMEETDVDLRAGNDPASQMQIFLEMQKKVRLRNRSSIQNIFYLL